MEWLIPITLVWALSMVYLGAWPVDVEGGKPIQQLAGLLLTVVLFLVVWGSLRMLLGGMGFAGRVVIPTAAATVAFPLLANGVFRVLGMRVARKAARH